MPEVLALLVAVASVSLTWLLCLRPMQHGSCHLLGASAARRAPAADALELARTELQLLRLQQVTRATPGTEGSRSPVLVGGERLTRAWVAFQLAGDGG